MLFQQDLNPDVPADTVRELIVERLRDESLARFAWSLFGGVMESRPALDAKIEAIAANWSLKRMAPTDRNVLRLGAFELLYTDTPPARRPRRSARAGQALTEPPSRPSSSTGSSIA